MEKHRKFTFGPCLPQNLNQKCTFEHFESGSKLIIDTKHCSFGPLLHCSTVCFWSTFEWKLVILNGTKNWAQRKVGCVFLATTTICNTHPTLEYWTQYNFVNLGHWINSTLRPRQYIFAQIIVCSLSFFSILPMAIAIFPQTGTISKSKLEPKFKNVKEETLRYNKGL